MIDGEDASGGGFPNEDAVERLSDLPVAVGFDPMVESGHRPEVFEPRLSGGSAFAGVLIGLGVVEVASSAGVGGVGEHVDGAAQVRGFTNPVRNLVAVNRCYPLQIDHRSDRHVAVT